MSHEISRRQDDATKRRRLMVIDDDAVSLAVLSLLLEAEGYEVAQAASGAAAIEALIAQLPESIPDVVLADLHMPGICGRDLAIALRSVARQATLLAMSATPGSADGYDGFVKKPLDPAALQDALSANETVDWTPSATGQEAVLDDAVYAKLRGMMPQQSVDEIYAVCLSDARDRVAEMRLAEAAGDLVSIRQLAHAIKGGAGMVGAQRLAAAAAELESGGYRKDIIPQLLNNLLSYCDQLQSILLSRPES
jgi:CheY-like chemotaxis protein